MHRRHHDWWESVLGMLTRSCKWAVLWGLSGCICRLICMAANTAGVLTLSGPCLHVPLPRRHGGAGPQGGPRLHPVLAVPCPALPVPHLSAAAGLETAGGADWGARRQALRDWELCYSGSAFDACWR